MYTISNASSIVMETGFVIFTRQKYEFYGDRRDGKTAGNAHRSSCPPIATPITIIIHRISHISLQDRFDRLTQPAEWWASSQFAFPRTPSVFLHYYCCDKFRCINISVKRFALLLGLASRGEMFSYTGTAVPARGIFPFYSRRGAGRRGSNIKISEFLVKNNHHQ